MNSTVTCFEYKTQPDRKKYNVNKNIVIVVKIFYVIDKCETSI